MHKLLAWNKEKDIPMQPERKPVHLEWARFPNGVKKQYIVHVEPVEPVLTPITIDNITNTLADFDDTDHQYTVNENIECLATGLLAIPDANFRVPFVRTDTNRKVYMPTTVVDGAFTLTLNFKTSGEWIVNSELLNSELTQAMFSIAEHRFKVI